MKKRLLPIGLLFLGGVSYAQVGIGTLKPNASSQLEVVANNKGILIPRISLKSATDTTTITNGNVESLLVFNTNTSSTLKPGYYYWYENKWTRIINQSDVESLDTNTKNKSLAVADGNLVLTDTDGNKVSVPLSDISVVTTLVNNNDGTYTYTSENGTKTIIDVPSDVVNNFQKIVNNANVTNIIKNIVKYTAGNVFYDGTKFTYIDNNGVQQNITIADIIKANQKTDTFKGNDPLVITEASLLNTAGGKDYTVSVKTASGKNLGVVKEAAVNPTVTINDQGELAADFNSLNAIKEVDTNYTALSSDAILLGNARSGSITITLPSPAGNKGKKITIKKYDSNEANYLSVKGAIDGVSGGLYTALPFSGWNLVSDGTIWKIIEKF